MSKIRTAFAATFITSRIMKEYCPIQPGQCEAVCNASVRVGLNPGRRHVNFSSGFSAEFVLMLIKLDMHNKKLDP